MATTTDSKRKPAAAAKPRASIAARSAPPAPPASKIRPAPPVSVIEPVATTPATVAPVAARMPAESPAPTPKETTMNDTMKNVADKAQETTKATVAKIGEQTKVAMEKGKVHMADYAEFQKGNVEAMAEAARIAAQGVETMGHDAAAFAKKTFDHTSETLKAMAQVKSPTELMKLQADYIRAAFDAMVAEASRTTEASLKLAGDVSKPMQNRMALATDKMKAAA